MQLSSYLQRIGFSGDPRPDLATLRRVHRAHLEAIAYENLDVQLGRRVGFDLDAIFSKLVTARRGGWCYEMNGLLAWALEEMGFEVMRLAGAVLRDRSGDETIGSHLALCVHLDAPYLADVGFGDGIVEPARIMAGEFHQDEFAFHFERLDPAWWRFHNQPHGGAASFDFQLSEARADVLARRCEWLQTSPESGFVRTSVCQRYVDGELRVLRGCVLKIIHGTHIERHIVDSLPDYRALMQSMFAIELSKAESEMLWSKAIARHRDWLGEQT